MTFGFGEGLIILAVVILLFGGKKLPQLGKSMGQAINGFKEGLKDDSKSQEDQEAKKVEDNKPS